MTYDDFKDLCVRRRSIRYFDKKPVSKDDVLKLLDVARLSPSVENMQPWHFHVVFEPGLRKKLTETCCYGNFVEGASVFIVVTCDKSLQLKSLEPVWNVRELEYSCMSAMENLMLGATAMNLGSCFVSLLHGDVQELLKIPLKEVVVGGVMLGHFRKGEEEPSGKHERKPLDAIYTLHE